MIVKRLELVTKVCSKIGIRRRAKPESKTFTKGELVKLSAWIHTMVDIRRQAKS